MQITLRARILLAAAIGIAGYVLVGPGDDTNAAAAAGNEPVTRVRHAQGRHVPRLDTSRIMNSLAHRVRANTSSNELFASHSWYTPPPPPPPAPAPVLTPAQEAALHAPVAPPLPFTFMGSYARAGSDPVFFLMHGDRVYDVKVGDTLENYTIDSLANGQLLMTYKPLQIQQQLTVGSAK